MRLFPGEPVQKFIEEVDHVVDVIKDAGDGCGEEYNRKIALKGFALIVLALERICLLLSICAGLLIGLILK